MKKIMIAMIALAISSVAVAQMENEKFVKAMEPKVIAVDTTHSLEGFTELANTFERIADVEKNQWLAYYYAAMCQVNAGLVIGSGGDMMAAKADKTDPYADKAELLINKAELLEKSNSEIYVIKKMIASLRMMGDPMNRYMTYGAEIQAMLDEARKLNPENPRVYMLEGQDKFYTPEQFGGSKSEAKVLFETAIKKYEAAKPQSSIHPSWGLPTTKYFHSQCQ